MSLEIKTEYCASEDMITVDVTRQNYPHFGTFRDVAQLRIKPDNLEHDTTQCTVVAQEEALNDLPVFNAMHLASIVLMHLSERTDCETEIPMHLSSPIHITL